ncbi:hypothetical protein [Wohlfahrtiimonas populi]|uniref:hypothetical protein n=1 Tax=Wohlfahrtiimonas populi TaxID=1940240 RepID=UPI00098CF1BC|nr:hypothetical protein [Wohlfahrtiimonas populi]
MKDFAKVFYGKDHDFLCQKVYDEDDEKYGISISVELDGAEAAQKLLYDSKEGRDKWWGEIIKLDVEKVEKLMSEAIEKTEGFLKLTKDGE